MISAQTRTLSRTHRRPDPLTGAADTGWNHHQTMIGTMSAEKHLTVDRAKGTDSPGKNPRTQTKLETLAMENMGIRRRAAKTERKGALGKARRRLPLQASRLNASSSLRVTPNGES